ncbi:RNA ligase family protein [Paenibacillus alvei]|uniref:RNA ligase family protein n=2 Tax=Paenibacillus alvei TaxID=44250 RepID=A0AAP6ZXS7_PAEAL|nr:RNA ligase family protein [Paenibacillus alvei]MCY9581425.1 RNA ligase family protein [Paenibacillus alvei]MCY9585567.1 RNA ligase family protein [Paenibacillus alvei]NEZ41878.1 2'-5' RNA ligase [Paenibacillus alvei]NOJ71636.1 RNA ligase family protein [Paenibacillus alvei]
MKIKYPKTMHLPWSRSYTNDDKILRNTNHFIGREVVVTEKMDGENTTMYTNGIHARSLDSKDHPSRHIVKMLHGGIQYLIPEGYRLCGENVYAKHSLYYTDLPSYFLLFSVWNEQNICLSWDDTLEWADKLQLAVVPVLYRGIWDEEAAKKCYTMQSCCGGEQEGYVVRLASAFQYDAFKDSVAKFVRRNHVQTDEHWLSKPIEPNRLIIR